MSFCVFVTLSKQNYQKSHFPLQIQLCCNNSLNILDFYHPLRHIYRLICSAKYIYILIKVKWGHNHVKCTEIQIKAISRGKSR